MTTESWLRQSKVSIVTNILETLKNFKNFNNITTKSPKSSLYRIRVVECRREWNQNW